MGCSFDGIIIVKILARATPNLSLIGQLSKYIQDGGSKCFIVFEDNLTHLPIESINKNLCW